METSGEIADNYGCDWHQHQRETKNKPACAAKEYNELLLLFLPPPPSSFTGNDVIQPMERQALNQ